MLSRKGEESQFEQTLNKVKKWTTLISEIRSFWREEPARTKAKEGDVSDEQIPGRNLVENGEQEAGSN